MYKPSDTEDRAVTDWLGVINTCMYEWDNNVDVQYAVGVA